MPFGRSPPNVRYEMHIADSRQQTTNTFWTKCSKMTEEGHRRHGMNGSTDGAAVPIKEECPKSSYNQGGRLKFFKDGKFILELERAREGERVSWVSVPRKTYWPPQGNAASTPTYRQESSTSLSVSDDNSSIQSSPWQRDHSWKQSNPRRNASKEMTFYFDRKQAQFLKKSSKRRRPYSMSPNLVDTPNIKSERTENNSVCNKVSNKIRVRPSLLTIIQLLIDKSVSSTSPRTEVVVSVSPRKRIMRELDKDKFSIDDACLKRSRNKIQNVSIPASISIGALPSTNIKIENSVRLNGNTDEMRAPRNSSYSITSLLAEDRILRRSPENSPSHFTPVTQPQYCSPTPEDPWYSESVDRLRSIELSQVDKRALSAYSSYPYMSPYMYPYSLPPYYSPVAYGGRNYMIPPVYPTPPIPVPIRHDTPSCSWTAETPKDAEHRDDSIADMPLNLSKHAG